jgi:hypothetical protein
MRTFAAQVTGLVGSFHKSASKNKYMGCAESRELYAAGLELSIPSDAECDVSVRHYRRQELLWITDTRSY